jgi:NAD(P)-dependent dehydrogenase (short-subunit alcohol dehydrogenase family)
MNSQRRDMEGKVCLVTGATAGIGQATALLLARGGATVIGVGRNPAKNDYSTKMIREETGNGSVDYLLADLSSQKDIHDLAHQFHSQFDRLDILVNNAGATFARRQESVDGIEMTFALNHLGYFLLTNLLVNSMEASEPARVINVSSSLHRFGSINFDDIPYENGYSRSKAYQRSKLANIAFTYELSRRLCNREITVNAMNPGLVATNVGNSAGGFAEKLKGLVDKIAGLTPEQGAETIIYLATSSEVDGVSGRYFEKKESLPSAKVSYDLDFCRRLWLTSERLTSLN